MTQGAFRSFRLAKWLGSTCSSLDIASNGLIAVDWAGQASKVLMTSMPKPPQLNRWLGVSCLTLTLPSGQLRAIGWGVRRPDDIWRAALREWYGERVLTIAKILNAFYKNLQAHGYCRRSQWTFLHARLVQLAKQWPALPARGLGVLSRHERKILTRAWSWVHDGEKCLRRWRKHYVRTSLAKHADLFDTIESMPLTLNQRLACIVDEDNNLVLAGAGTGKTSTTMGRVAFLVRSGQAQPEDILLLAYGKDAAKEMRERLEARVGIKGVKTSTFHSLGQDMLGQPSLTPMADDEATRKRFVQLAFEYFQSEPGYRKRLLQYFENYLFPIKNPFDFASLGEYFAYLAEHEVRTLKGELVKSMAECRIANFLFKMGVEYQYEARYKVSTRTAERRDYHPDFYLPTFGIYIEHFGTDRHGNTAPYVDRKAYHQDMGWKRDLHKQHQTRLIETFHFEQQEGQLLPLLEKRLLSAGVTFNPLPDEAMLETLREFGVVTAFAELLEKLLTCYKAADLAKIDLEARINAAPCPDQMRAALELLMPIYGRYQADLEGKGQIDYDDMIVKAVRLAEQGDFKAPWRFVLVDEYQDISEPRARLVKALRRSQPNGSLFCVGDDWQSIYRFAGSDIRLTSQFEAFFGATAINALDKTFRFNDRINAVASRFVMRNPAQLKKNIHTHTLEESPAVSLFRTELEDDEALPHVLARIAARAKPGSLVYILARFNFLLPDPAGLKQLNGNYPNLTIKTYSIHTSKGQEADYIVVLGNKAGKFGMPPQKTSHPLLEALLPPREAFVHAEERRLFYVALTRAKRRVYLVVGKGKASSFIKELLDDQYDVEVNEFGDSAEVLAQAPACPACQEGELTLRTRKNGLESFFFCSLSPRCSHTETACPDCQSQMRKEGRHLICKENCGGWVALCPLTGGRMVSRGTGKKFWGCSDYRRDDADSCSHTETMISPPVGCKARILAH